MLKLFSDELNKFYYNYVSGHILIVHPNLVKFNAFDEPYLEFPLQCKVLRNENYIFLTPGKKDIVYLFEGYVGKVIGNCQFLYYDDEKPSDEEDLALIIAKPKEKIVIYSGDTRFGEWESVIVTLKNGKIDYKTVV